MISLSRWENKHPNLQIRRDHFKLLAVLFISKIYAVEWKEPSQLDCSYEIHKHMYTLSEPVTEISNNVVCATSKASDQPAHTRSLIRAFASRLSILWLLSYWLMKLQRLVRVYTCQNIKLLEISCRGSSDRKIITILAAISMEGSNSFITQGSSVHL